MAQKYPHFCMKSEYDIVGNVLPHSAYGLLQYVSHCNENVKKFNTSKLCGYFWVLQQVKSLLLRHKTVKNSHANTLLYSYQLYGGLNIRLFIIQSGIYIQLGLINFKHFYFNQKYLFVVYTKIFFGNFFDSNSCFIVFEYGALLQKLFLSFRINLKFKAGYPVSDRDHLYQISNL